MKNQKIHMVGVGGIGMSGIAEILLRSGYVVTGSDAKENRQTQHLKALRMKVSIGHHADHVQGADLLVISSAVPKDNPEILAAKRAGIPILARAEMLAELMRKKRSIVVAGAHGKTTTSAMITTILMESGEDPTAVIGGRLRAIASNARIGNTEWFVAESDESDGSFVKLLPTVGIITNLDREHLEHYGSYERLEDAFVHFANQVPFDGVVIVCRDDPRACAILPRIEKPCWTYGFNTEADIFVESFRPDSDGIAVQLRLLGNPFSIHIPVPGRHNVLNALAACGAGYYVGLKPDQISNAMRAYQGIERRLEWKGEIHGIRVLDDYAHHPTEILATIEAIRSVSGPGAIRVLFQPHRYSRTRDLWSDFVSVFDGVEQVVLLPIYAASEVPIAGVDSKVLAEAMKERGKTEIYHASNLEEGILFLVRGSKPGDILVTMGAGDITLAGERILAHLEQDRIRNQRKEKKGSKS